MPDQIKLQLTQLFTYLLRNIRVGLPGHLKPAENMSWIEVEGTTHVTANTEFSIAHGMANAPRVAFPCLDLTSANAQLIPLTTSKAADSKRVYFKSSSTNAAFTLFIETR